MKHFLLLLSLLCLLVTSADSKVWTVTNGSTLKAALTNSSVAPGDTILMRGGLYVNPTNGQDAVAWNCTLSGTAAKRILVTSYPGEWARLDGADSKQNGILQINCSYVWFWGFEIFSSDPGRHDPGAGSYPDINYIKFGCGIASMDNGTGNKFINLVIHDTFIGFESNNAMDDLEAYGCIIYNSGWLATDRPHGHNIYIHNKTGKTKQFNDCITWGAFESNVQAWSGSDADMDNFFFDGHIAFTPIDGYNFLLGSATYNNPVVTNGMFYHKGGTNWNLGYGHGPGVGGSVSGNYVAYGTQKIASFSGTTFNNNFIYYESLEGSFPSGTGNTITQTKPTVTKVFVRKNTYEAGRANIVVFNWGNANTVDVDLSSIYKVGDTYKIVDVQNPLVNIAQGTYSGASISLPMTLTAIQQPIGNSGTTRTHTAKEFNCFIAMGGSIGTSVNENNGVVDGYSLEQNYPNPFNPTTNIEFTLRESGLTTLIVYDILGQEIATLVNGMLPMGNHSYVFDAKKLTSGIYFYTLKTNSFSVTKRMTLIK